MKAAIGVTAVLVALALPATAGAQFTPTPGVVYSWGANSRGQLGNGTTTGSAVPVLVPGLTDVVMVGTGDYHSIALKSDGTVWTWGSNEFGQLGNGTTTASLVPVQAAGLDGVVQVAAGDHFNLALKADGTVWGWGFNNTGRLGDGTTTDRHLPIQIPGLADIVDISAGQAHALAVRYGAGNNRTVWAWGFNPNGQIGDGTTEHRLAPVKVLNLDDIKYVSAGHAHSLAQKGDGTGWAWGIGARLGAGLETYSYVPVQVVASGRVGGMAAGDSHSLFAIAVSASGTQYVFGAGSNSVGQLGTGNNTLSNVPVQTANLGSLYSIGDWFGRQPYIAADFHSLAALADGTVWAWGSNGNGQLGNGTFTNSNVPIQVPGLTGVVSVAGSSHHLLNDVGHSLAISAAVVSMQPRNLEFGSIGTGTISAAQTVTLLNEGPAAATVEDIRSCAGSIGGPFVFSTPALPFVLPSGATATVDVRFAPGNIPGPADNCVAAIHSGFHGPHLTGLRADGDPFTDVALAKTTDTATAVPGDRIRYGLRVTQGGLALADSVTIADVLPAGLTFASCSVEAGGVCSGSGNNRTVTFTSWAPGSSSDLLIEAIVDATVADGTVLTNTANSSTITMGSCATCDLNPANDSAMWETTVHNRADLFVTQQVVKGASRQLTYTISVKNIGPYGARQLLLNDVLPGTTRFVSLAAGEWTCNAPPPSAVGTVSCALGALEAGATKSFTMVLKTTAPGTVEVVNTASVSQLTFDPNLANNSATLSTRVSGK